MGKFRTEIRLSREMTLLDATMIGVGAMIGAGIFVLTGIAAGVAGPALLVAFVLNGAIALLTAMSYAELGSCYHDAGGGYLWVKEGLPKWNGFLSGWMSWFAHAVACSLYALGFGAYFNHVLLETGFTLPQWGFFSSQKLLAVLAALVFAYINFRGASETGKIGNFITITKIVILGIFVTFGIHLMFGRGNWQASFEPFMPEGWLGIVKAMGLTFIAFQGFEVISQSSEEIRNPKKNIPRAIFLSLLIVLPIYLLVAVAALGSADTGSETSWAYLARLKETALVDVARNFFYGGGVMLLVGGLISTMSALNATVYSSSRVAFAMGRDRNFPSFFSRVHENNYTPHWAILVSLAVIVLMCLSLPIEDVASAADIMFMLLFIQVNLAMIRLRRKRPDLDRGFVVPLFPWLTIAGIILLLVLAAFMYDYSVTAWIVSIAWIASGLVVYRVYASSREIEYAHKVAALERIERQEYRILVCISNPQTVPALSSLAKAVARSHRGEIIFLHVIEVSEGASLAAGEKMTEEAEELFAIVESCTGESEVPCRSLVKVSHRISTGILETAREEQCNFIVIARQKNPGTVDRIFSSLIDTVLQKAPSEVAVLHGHFDPGHVKRIMIPYAENVHTNLATEIAPALKETFQADLQVAFVLNPDDPRDVSDQRLEKVRGQVRETLPGARIKAVCARDILAGVVEASRGADMLLMGGRSGDFMELLLTPSLTQEITEQAHCPVVWVKEYEEREPLWRMMIRSQHPSRRQ
ncbi:MAG: amino acid transporter [Deltaproteobacteria bacterium HGW-Deltaproteobacteria-19]|jgi:amino acid transporter|nr:MAG: amino acid transporter [Deltaproteobacteria bacterium HGW-Deltaproteobacteria-19]